MLEGQHDSGSRGSDHSDGELGKDGASGSASWLERQLLRRLSDFRPVLVKKLRTVPVLDHMVHEFPPEGDEYQQIVYAAKTPSDKNRRLLDFLRVLDPGIVLEFFKALYATGQGNLANSVAGDLLNLPEARGASRQCSSTNVISLKV